MRESLSLQDALREARAIASRGIKRITLVTGEMPWEVVGEGITKFVRELRVANFFQYISGNFGALPFNAFEDLARAGLDSYQIFQETYDRGVFVLMHPKSPKGNYDWRFDTPRRALQAGIPTVGMGILVGLAPFDCEVEALSRHIIAIENEFPRRVQLINLPRLQFAYGAVLSRVPFPVQDDAFLRAIGDLRVAFPDMGIAFTTREKPSLRDRALQYGVTHLSVESRTTVGGYADPKPEERGQFHLGDRRTVFHLRQVLDNVGLCAE